MLQTEDLTRLFLYYVKESNPKVFTRMDNHFNKEDHPQSEKTGRFIKKGTTESKEQKEQTDKHRDISQILGEEFTGYSGKSAIDKLLKEKRGYIRDAFSREDLGGITLLWGNDKMGLQHIIKRRKETGQNLKELLTSLTETIENGDLSQDRDDFIIRYKGKRVVIKLNLFNKKLTFLMTAYYEYN